MVAGGPEKDMYEQITKHLGRAARALIQMNFSRNRKINEYKRGYANLWLVESLTLEQRLCIKTTQCHEIWLNPCYNVKIMSLAIINAKEIHLRY